MPPESPDADVVTGRVPLLRLALAFPVMMAVCYVLKPSASGYAAFWPPHAIMFLTFRMLPHRYWPLAAAAFTLVSSLVVNLVTAAAAGLTPAVDYLLEVSLANVIIGAGMATASAALRRVPYLHRSYTLVLPVWMIAIGVGAVPGVILTAWLHARVAHEPVLLIDIMGRLLSCVLSITAGVPLLLGLVRGFREPAKALAGRWEASAIVLAFSLLSACLVLIQWPLSDRFAELIFLTLPLFWLALRGSRRAVGTAIAVLATFIALAAARGFGAFSALAHNSDWSDGIVLTQIYLLIACCEALVINHAMLELNGLLEKYDRKQMQLAAYAEALDHADDSARRAAAADLHDGVGQILAGQGLILGAMRRLSADQTPLRDMLEQALAASQEAQTAVRHTIQDLRPPELEGASMSDIMASIVGMFGNRYGFRVQWSVRGDAHPDRLQSQLVYRIVRELIYNAYKHSQSDCASVTVYLGADEIEARVVDHGVGFDASGRAAASGDRFGLVNLAERVRSAGGRLSIDSALGSGCRATFWLPLRQPPSATLSP